MSFNSVGNKEMENMIQIVNHLQDKCSPLGFKIDKDLPQIAVVGGQSAGKSSVLENIVGHDFLPRGSGIVTKRPLILQLINSKHASYGEFLHKPGVKFTDFNDIRDEIVTETDRETDETGISAKPINLKIYSPHYLDLTLIDLPGITKNPVGNQPEDIEHQVKEMILTYIRKSNCLILAVTAANQDLATSDAIKLAKEVDPNGERTIGVITKLDIMDPGTNARQIFDGKLLPLKRGYIGVINRNQDDIINNRPISEALKKEKKFFKDSDDYRDIAFRMGTNYLQKYLNKELSRHIFRLLPSIRDKFSLKSNDLENQLSTIAPPIESDDYINEVFVLVEDLRRAFELAIGRSASVDVDGKRLTRGTMINKLVNEKYPNELTELSYDENELIKEIATTIQNIHGTYIGIFTPDNAFEAVIRQRIKLFRDPSIKYVDYVTRELENAIKDCIKNIRFPKLKDLISRLVMEYIGQCQRQCKSSMNHFVEVQLAYMNTRHEEFVETNKIEAMLPSYESKNSQFEVLEAISKSPENEMDYKSDTESTESPDEDVVIDAHLKRQIIVVKELVESYFRIMKKTFKDYLPKLVHLELINATKIFISIKLKQQIDICNISLEDLMSGDPDEEIRTELSNQMMAYKEAIEIIDQVVMQKK